MGTSPQIEICRWHNELRRSLAAKEIIRAIEQRIESETDPKKLWVLKFALAKEHEAQGNVAAAERIRREDPATQADEWVDELRRTHPVIDVIPAIEKEIEVETDPAKLRVFRFALASEHKEVGNYAAAEAIYLQIAAEDPDEPMPLT